MRRQERGTPTLSPQAALGALARRFCSTLKPSNMQAQGQAQARTNSGSTGPGAEFLSRSLRPWAAPCLPFHWMLTCLSFMDPGYQPRVSEHKKGRRSREATRWQEKGSWQEEIKHVRKKQKSWNKYKGTFLVSLFLAGWKTQTQENKPGN